MQEMRHRVPRKIAKPHLVSLPFPTASCRSLDQSIQIHRCKILVLVAPVLAYRTIREEESD